MLVCCVSVSVSAEQYPLYFCTAASSEFYKALLNLIGSIHKHHYSDLGEIAVFDLGLTRKQQNELIGIDRVRLCRVEKQYSHVLKPLLKAGNKGPWRAGAYAFKPVAVKQALDMYPYVLWLDAGATVFGSLRTLFDHIRAKGYFLHNSSNWPLCKQLCSYPARTFGLHSPNTRWILDPENLGVESGVMGFAASIRDRLVLPLYEAARDLRNFIDDGTSAGGLGTGRHDQALVAAQAYIEKLHIHHHVGRFQFTYEVEGKSHELGIGSDKDPFKNQFHGIVTLRKWVPWFKHFSSYIRRKPGKSSRTVIAS